MPLPGRAPRPRAAASATIRDFRRADGAAVGALLHELEPEHPAQTAEGLVHWIESQPERARLRSWVAEEGGDLVGWAAACFHWSSSAERVAWLWAGVREDGRGRGIGGSLFRLAEAYLASEGARKLETHAREGTPGETFARARGFVRTRSEVYSALEPEAADVSELAPLAAAKAREGFRLLPLRALAERPREIHVLYAATSLDIPADDPEDDIPYEDFERELLESPDLEWGGSHVVLAGERPVALAFLTVNRSLRLAENEMTGTLREFRGRGLARLAKLATIRWAQENGIREIWTGNDAENVAMRALNESLGYRPRLVRAQLAREVARVAARQAVCGTIQVERA